MIRLLSFVDNHETSSGCLKSILRLHGFASRRRAHGSHKLSFVLFIIESEKWIESRRAYLQSTRRPPPCVWQRLCLLTRSWEKREEEKSSLVEFMRRAETAEWAESSPANTTLDDALSLLESFHKVAYFLFLVIHLSSPSSTSHSIKMAGKFAQPSWFERATSYS